MEGQSMRDGAQFSGVYKERKRVLGVCTRGAVVEYWWKDKCDKGVEARREGRTGRVEGNQGVEVRREKLEGGTMERLAKIKYKKRKENENRD